MGRVRPLDIEVIKNPFTQVSATVQYDRQRKDYCCEVGRITIRAERASDLGRKVAEALRRGAGLSWQRSIVVERGKPDWQSHAVREHGMRATISLSVARGEVAERADGELMFRDWPPDLDDLPEGLNPPESRMVYWLPKKSVEVERFSDARWKAWTEIVLMLGRYDAGPGLDSLRRAADLRALLKSDEDSRKAIKPTDFDVDPDCIR